MPKKYHIETRPVPPRRPRTGKYGIVDWREDCARCHNCVKKACVYDRHREEQAYIRNLNDVDALFFDCMGCFSCVQECTKNLLRLSINPAYENLGNRYWTPDIIQATWLQAETAKIPVSGAGYGGKFSGHGFDGMWTDMSEIVRPTRDGIHGREYISTSVDIGMKPSYLALDGGKINTDLPQLMTLPMPLLIDMIPEQYEQPSLDAIIAAAAVRTDLVAVMDSRKWPVAGIDAEKHLPHIAFYFPSSSPLLPREVLGMTRLVEIEGAGDVKKRMGEIREINPGMVIAVRVQLDAGGIMRALELAGEGVGVIHVVADNNGDELGAEKPRFIKEIVREIHTALIRKGVRDEVTLIAGGGIALPEHVAKCVICGADLISTSLPLLIALECHLCESCDAGRPCPAKIGEITMEYGVGRMTNLISAWHNQLIELMGAMGMRDARRLRGDVGRAMFFEQLEEETFGKLFGSRLRA
jgi:ferredoxin